MEEKLTSHCANINFWSTDELLFVVRCAHTCTKVLRPLFSFVLFVNRKYFQNRNINIERFYVMLPDNGYYNIINFNVDIIFFEIDAYKRPRNFCMASVNKIA